MGERDSKDLTVLVVEDVEDVRLFMRLELEGFGFIVLEAADGRSAVDVQAGELRERRALPGEARPHLQRLEA